MEIPIANCRLVIATIRQLAIGNRQSERLTSPTTMSISGYATLEGTTNYRNRFPTAAAHHFREQQQLLLSSIGIGTYLGNADRATDQNYTEAVARAVQLGANVIDSAANYRFQ